jgi:hypothetical protein
VPASAPLPPLVGASVVSEHRSRRARQGPAVSRPVNSRDAVSRTPRAVKTACLVGFPALEPLCLQDDLACGCGEDDAGERGRAWVHGEWETVGAEPGGEAIRVTVEVQPRELHAGGAVGCRGASGKRCAVVPLDEEGKRRLGGGLLDAGKPPVQAVTASRGPRAGGHD